MGETNKAFPGVHERSPLMPPGHEADGPEQNVSAARGNHVDEASKSSLYLFLLTVALGG